MKEIKFEISGKEYTVGIENFGAYEVDVIVNERNYKVKLKDLGVEQVVNKVKQPIKSTEFKQTATKQATNQQSSQAPTTGGGSVLAPLPGLILKINVKEGEKVVMDQNLIVMEAMKMENEVYASKEGIVKEIRVKEGDTVNEGDVLIIIE